MIVLTSCRQAESLRGSIPELAIRRMHELGGSVLVLQEGDDIARGIPQAGRYGLLTHLDDEWQAPFDWVRYLFEGGKKFFEAQLNTGGKRQVIVIVPDEKWVDERLAVVLDVEGEEASPEGPPGCGN
jgi:hypothetical protein